jgi:D-sedoheptulose 7-phosphate isomerase
MTTEATGFLYPFIDADEEDAQQLVATMARSATAKLHESEALRHSVVEQNAEVIDRVGRALARRLARGGRLLAMGNGGSATDAEGLVALFAHPPEGVSFPALALTGESAVVTALANDVGFAKVFSRQIMALAGPDDCLVGFSTSGDSANLLVAFEEAAARGLLTAGFSGLGGGGMAALDALDECFVVPSDSVHRIQEVQDALAYGVWSAVQHWWPMSGDPAEPSPGEGSEP